MANKIIPKYRELSTGEPTLQKGEIASNLFDKYFFIGTGAGNIAFMDKTQTDSKLDLKAPLANPTFTGTVSGVTKAMVGLSNVDNTSDAAKPISTATASALAGKLDATANAQTASKLLTARNIAIAGDVVGNANFDGSGNIIINATVGNDSHSHAFANLTGKPTSIAGYGITDAINVSEKGQANGVATLDAGGLVPANQLPSFVDDVIEAANLGSFPATGETGKIYVALDTNITYRWSGTVYVEISSGAVTSVAGKTGVVSLTKSDVGLGNVDNTSDANKPISTAQQAEFDTKADIATTLAGYGITDAYTIAGIQAYIASYTVDGGTY